MERVKIVLDSDVLIHFAKAGHLNMLPSIMAEYDHVILSTVYGEVRSIRIQLDNQIALLKNIRVVQFEPTGDMRREYAYLKTRFGQGESACMAYCRYTHNVIGSSNLKDIKEYCSLQRIVYLTTIDFLYYALQRGKMTKKECESFLQEVREKGSRLPDVDFDSYMPNALL